MTFDEHDILAASLHRGENRAFEYLFDNYYEGLLNYAGRIVGDVEVAHDLVQGAFCKLYEDCATLEIHLSIKSYLYKSVYYRCLDEIKHRKVVNDYVDRELLDFYFTEVVQSPEAELELLGEDVNRALQEAMEQLPDRCREIFKLSKLDELSNKEIAERLGLSVKTVEVQMTKALSRLRKELEWLLNLILFVNF